MPPLPVHFLRLAQVRLLNTMIAGPGYGFQAVSRIRSALETARNHHLSTVETDLISHAACLSVGIVTKESFCRGGEGTALLAANWLMLRNGWVLSEEAGRGEVSVNVTRVLHPRGIVVEEEEVVKVYRTAWQSQEQGEGAGANGRDS